MIQLTSNSCLLNEVQVAEYLNVKVSTLQRWRWAGTGPTFIKVGACVRYDAEDLREYLDLQRRPPTIEHDAGIAS